MQSCHGLATTEFSDKKLVYQTDGSGLWQKISVSSKAVACATDVIMQAQQFEAL